MKKLLSIISVVLAICVLFSACGAGNESDEDKYGPYGYEKVNEVPIERVASKTVEPANGFAGGNGTKDSPFEISNAAELQYFANLFYDYKVAEGESELDHSDKYQKAYYVLTNDIVVNSDEEMQNADTKAPTYKWEAIGRSNADNNVNYMQFKGVFDGQNHYISGLYNCVLGTEEAIHPDASIGFFAKLVEATVCNLTIRNSYFYVYNEVLGIGALASECYESNIDNCHGENIKVYAHSSTGGIAGLVGSVISTANFTNCSVSGEVKGGYSSDVGGIVSGINDGIIDSCINNATIIGFENAIAGGVCCNVSDSQTTETYDNNQGDAYEAHQNHGVVRITNCVNNGAVTTESFGAGGIAARANSGKESVVIENCKNTGSIVGKEEVGGICGTVYSEKGDVYNDDNKSTGDFVLKNCENTGSINGEAMVSGIVGHAWSKEAAKVEIDGCKNSGKIEGNTIGGVVGASQTSNASQFIVKSCENNGEIVCTDTIAGGIVGLFTSTDTSNAGYVYEITGCKNGGKLSNQGKDGSAVNNATIGGVLGKKESTGGASDKFLISNCENTAEINCTSDVYVGGIAGYLLSTTNETKSVVNCTNSGSINVSVNDYHGEEDTKIYNYAGGIAGTAQNTVIFENCKSTGSFTVTSGDENKIVYQEMCGLVVESNGN